MSRRSISPTVLVTTWSPRRTVETRQTPHSRGTYQEYVKEWFTSDLRGEYTESELADFCNCNIATVLRWRRGKRPHPLFHGHLAEFFALNEGRLITDVFIEVKNLWQRRE